MAAQQQQSQQSGGDNSLAPVWITVLLFFTLYIVWTTGHQYIVAGIFYLDILQIKLIQLVMGQQFLAQELYILQTIDPSIVEWGQAMDLSRAVGNYIRYPLIGLLSIMGVWLYYANVTLKFRKTYDMNTLRMQEQANWPAIMPVLKLDLVSVDLNEGPWAMALSPIEFARKYQLLKKENALLDKPKRGDEMTAGIKRGEAKQVFTLQLGPYWDGFERCPPHVRALAAIFMARINRDRKSASMILDTLDKTVAQGKPDYRVANSVLKKFQNDIKIQEIMSKHAYRLTVMASLLLAARDDGVVSSSEFLWLKPVDRRLWYMLNCVGRQTPFAEVAGPFAHWKAEKIIGRRTLVPMIDEAIKALEDAVKQVKLTPKELEELKPS